MRVYTGSHTENSDSIAINLLDLHLSHDVVPLAKAIVRALLLDLHVVRPLSEGLAGPRGLSCRSRSCITPSHPKLCALDHFRYSCRTLSAPFQSHRHHFSSCRGSVHDQAPLLREHDLMASRDSLGTLQSSWMLPLPALWNETQSRPKSGNAFVRLGTTVARQDVYTHCTMAGSPQLEWASQAPISSTSNMIAMPPTMVER